MAGNDSRASKATATDGEEMKCTFTELAEDADAAAIELWTAESRNQEMQSWLHDPTKDAAKWQTLKTMLLRIARISEDELDATCAVVYLAYWENRAMNQHILKKDQAPEGDKVALDILKFGRAGPGANTTEWIKRACKQWLRKSISVWKGKDQRKEKKAKGEKEGKRKVGPVSDTGDHPPKSLKPPTISPKKTLPTSIYPRTSTLDHQASHLRIVDNSPRNLSNSTKYIKARTRPRMTPRPKTRNWVILGNQNRL